MLSNMQIEENLQERGWAGAIPLFVAIQTKARTDLAYRRHFATWKAKGGTMRIRALSEPFGDYWNSLAFANKVDALDSVVNP